MSWSNWPLAAPLPPSFFCSFCDNLHRCIAQWLLNFRRSKADNCCASRFLILRALDMLHKGGLTWDLNPRIILMVLLFKQQLEINLFLKEVLNRKRWARFEIPSSTEPYIYCLFWITRKCLEAQLKKKKKKVIPFYFLKKQNPHKSV